MNILLTILLSTLAVVVSSYILPGVEVDGFFTALVVAIVLGVVNAFLKPILVLLTMPITLLTFGLFVFVINAVLILLVDAVVPGFTVQGFWWALIFGLVLSLLNSFLNSLTKT